MKILRVIDTRQYEEGPDDRWHPIPGSGDEHECARCGRFHEIHFHVRADDGREIIVGGGCAREAGLIDQSRHLSLASTAQTIARLEAQITDKRAKIAAYDAIAAEVEMLPLPPVTEEPYRAAVGNPDRYPEAKQYRMGDAWCIDWKGRFDLERQQCLTDGWRGNRIKDRTGSPIRPHWGLSDMEKRLARAQKRLQALAETAELTAA